MNDATDFKMALLVRAAITGSVIIGASQRVSCQCPQLGWTPLGHGLDSWSFNAHVSAIAVFDDGQGGGPTIFAGGAFSQSEKTPMANIAKWDGMNWTDIGGVNNPVFAMAVFDDGNGSALYVGGQFTVAGGQQINRIAKWNGRSWSSVGGGIPTGTVRSMLVVDDGSGPGLFVGGTFETVGAVPARNVAKWNGTSWSAIGTGLGASGHVVYSLAEHDDGTGAALYAGGSFTNGLSPGIARWNGTSWVGVGTGTTSTVFALAACHSGKATGLYAGGNFISMGGVEARYIAKWDGTSWASLPPVASFNPVPGNPVRALISTNDAETSVLTVGTERVYSGVSIDSQILRWDGLAWSFLGSGVGPTDGFFCPVYAFAEIPSPEGSRLCIGGRFLTAGGIPAPNIVQWFTSAYFVDRNQNRNIDDCDIASGISPDCDSDGVPDETQTPRTYILDSGTFGGSIALVFGGDYLWLNQFTVRPHGEVIHCIEMPWTPYGHDGLPFQILVYRDPNNDGNPVDAELLTRAAASNFYSGYVTPSYARIIIPPTFVGKPGDVFFVGGAATLPPGDALPTRTPNTISPNRSWRKSGPVNSIDINNLSTGIAGQFVAWNWQVRAISMDCNNNGIFDICDIEEGTSQDLNDNKVPDECELPCPADISPQPFNNGLVNIDDLVMVITNWGQPSGPADITNDKVVNIDDLVAVITTWGPCP